MCSLSLYCLVCRLKGRWTWSVSWVGEIGATKQTPTDLFGIGGRFFKTHDRPTKKGRYIGLSVGINFAKLALIFIYLP